MIVQTEGVVIKSFDYRETSRIATFFTRDRGKVCGVLKGIRKDPRKFGSSVDKFSLNDIVYYQYSRSDLHLISQCDLKNVFFPVREDYRRSLAANYFLELIDRTMLRDHPHPSVYQLICDSLKTLETTSDIDKLIIIFQIKMLFLSGFSPHLDACVRCRRKSNERIRFSMAGGGLICGRCLKNESALCLVSRGAVASMQHLIQQPWAYCLRLSPPTAVKDELKRILGHFLTYHFEKKINTTEFI